MTEALAVPPGIVSSDADRRELPVWRLLLTRPTFVAGAVILLFWVACAIFGTAIAPHDPLAQQLLATNQAPSGAHWFGTDQLGRDVLSRVIVGARTILIIAPLATVVGTVLGTALGLRARLPRRRRRSRGRPGRRGGARAARHPGHLPVRRGTRRVDDHADPGDRVYLHATDRPDCPRLQCRWRASSITCQRPSCWASDPPG